MIVEKKIRFAVEQHTFEKTKSIEIKNIKYAIISTISEYIPHITKLKKKNKNFNENQYTQEFVAILNRTLLYLDLPYCAGREYIDIHTPNANTQRTVDFYFYSSEYEESTKSIYSFEAKRLPTFPTEREKEYVIGCKKNKGGIERFINEEHGKGLSECGLIAFVEDKTLDYWFSRINSWIIELKDSANWWRCGHLTDFEDHEIYAKSYSCIKRTKLDMILFHLWINIPKSRKDYL
jgi:hypothetical protein